MPKQVQPEWTRFTVGSPSDRENWAEASCQPMTDIYHVAHIDTAWQIVADRRIKASLVYDKSKLNTSPFA